MKKTRAALSENEEFMAEFKDAQARHASRKRGLKGNDDDTVDMLEVFAMKWAKANTGANYDTDTDDDDENGRQSSGSDSDDDKKRKGRRKQKDNDKKSKKQLDFEEKWNQSRQMREAYEKEAEEKRKTAKKEFGGRSEWILNQNALGEGADTYYDYDPGILGGVAVKRGKYFTHMLDKNPLNVDAYFSNDGPYDDSGGRGNSANTSSKGSNSRPKPLSFAQKLARKKEQLLKKLAKEAQRAQSGQDAQAEQENEVSSSQELEQPGGDGTEGFEVLNADGNSVKHSMNDTLIGDDTIESVPSTRNHSSSDMKDPSASSVSFAVVLEAHNQLPYTDGHVIEFRPEAKDRSFTSWMEAQKINKNRAYNRAAHKSTGSSGMQRGTPYVFDPVASSHIPAKGNKIHQNKPDGLYRGTGALVYGSDASLGIHGTLKTINVEAVSTIKKGKNKKGVDDSKNHTYAGVGTPSRDISTEKLLFDINKDVYSDDDNAATGRARSPYPTPINIETNDSYSSEEEDIKNANKTLLSNDNIIKLMKEAGDFYAENLDYTTYFPHDLYADIIQQHNEYRGSPPSRGYVWNHARASKNMKYGKLTGVSNHSPIKKRDAKSPFKQLPAMRDVKLSLNMPKTIPPLDYDSYWGKKHVQAGLVPDRLADVTSHLLSPISSKTPETLPIYRANHPMRTEQEMDDDITLSPSTSPRLQPTKSVNPYKIVASTKVIRNIHDPAALSPSVGDNDSVASYNTDDTHANKYKTNNVALSIRNVKGVLAHVNNQKQPCLAELVVERRIIYDQPSGITGVEGVRSIAGSSVDSLGGDTMSCNSFASSITGSHVGIPRMKKSTKNIRSYGEFNESVFLRRPAGDSDSDSDISDSHTSNSNTMTIRSLDTITSKTTVSTTTPWNNDSAKFINHNRKNEMFLGIKEKNEINQSIPKGNGSISSLIHVLLTHTYSFTRL